MELYLHSAGVLSVAGNNSSHDFLEALSVSDETNLRCKEPDYSAYIPAMQLRRMSKAVRMGIGASKIAIENAGNIKPDAFSVGTALGCLYDTEIFLSKMIDQDEQMLTPTAFIQSTHNTVAGQIALVNNCNGHNLTFVQRGHSFEHAMINAGLYLNEHATKNILVGGIDEMTPTTDAILQQFGIKNNAEGAAFFVMSLQPPYTKAVCIKEILTLTTKDKNELTKEIKALFNRNQCNQEFIDTVLLGINADDPAQPIYEYLQETIFANASQYSFKNYSGEYPTATAFALGLLQSSVDTTLPGSCKLHHVNKLMKNVMIVNHYLDYWSVWMLTVE